MSNIGRLAELYTRMKNHIADETQEAKDKMAAQAKEAKEKNPDAKIDESTVDKIDMVALQQQFAADELFVSTVSNVMKKESDTASGIAQNFK